MESKRGVPRKRRKENDMPNWVSNQLNITGPKEELDRFQEQAGKAYATKKQTFTDKGIDWEDET